MIRSAKEARGIVKQFGDALYIFKGIHPNAIASFLAEGYLAALKGPEVRALVKALERFEENKEFRYGHSCSSFRKCAVKALAQYREAVKP